MHNGMAVKLLKRMAGPEGNYPPGSVLNLDNENAKHLIDSGYAIKDGDINGDVLHNNRRKPNARKKS